jgi:alpha-ketoglutarate-dependent taurine dioxygenase
MTTSITAPVTLDIAPLSGTIGAEIRNVDLHQPLDASTVAAIRQALLDYKVIFLPGQHLSAAEHKEFAGYFGVITNAHPVVPGIDQHREVFEIDYTKARTVYGDPSQKPTDIDRIDAETSNKWHTDVTFVETPPLGSILNAIVIPAAGGDTLWADTNAAYEGLSNPIKDLVDGLTAVHDGNRQFGRILKAVGKGEWEGREFTELTSVEHPVVRTHPETGRRSLFVNPGFTIKIKGLTGKESDALLQFLYAHMTTPEHVVRYRWEAGDLGFWDNRTTMHYAITDYGDAHRVIQRVTIKGDKPF